jgi:hypothetical protein
MKILSTLMIPAAALAMSGMWAADAGAAGHIPLHGPEIEKTQVTEIGKRDNRKRRHSNYRRGFKKDKYDHFRVGRRDFDKRRHFDRDFGKRRHFRHHRHRHRDSGFRIRIAPALPFYVAPPVARQYIVPNQCSYWAERCRENWGYGASYRGCLRYHGCL